MESASNYCTFYQSQYLSTFYQYPSCMFQDSRPNLMLAAAVGEIETTQAH